MGKQTAEQKMIADAEVQEEIPAAPVETDRIAEVATKFVSDQFGSEGEPKEGVVKLDGFIREVIYNADQLEADYRHILKLKEANRTLLRALSDAGAIPTEVSDFYYPPRKRKGSTDEAAA